MLEFCFRNGISMQRVAREGPEARSRNVDDGCVSVLPSARLVFGTCTLPRAELSFSWAASMERRFGLTDAAVQGSESRLGCGWPGAAIQHKYRSASQGKR